MKRLDRREVVRDLLAERGDLLVVAGLGASAWDVAAAGDCPLDFPLWGAMGGAAMIGLGLALAQPARPVLVITGDGELLMGLSSLASIGVQHPANFSLVVLDNGEYGETGRQPTHTALGTDLTAVARACGFSNPRLLERMEDLPDLRTAIHRRHGPLFASVVIAPDDTPKVLPPRDGAWLKHRMRVALLGAAAFE